MPERYRPPPTDRLPFSSRHRLPVVARGQFRGSSPVGGHDDPSGLVGEGRSRAPSSSTTPSPPERSSMSDTSAGSAPKAAGPSFSFRPVALSATSLGSLPPGVGRPAYDC